MPRKANPAKAKKARTWKMWAVLDDEKVPHTVDVSHELATTWANDGDEIIRVTITEVPKHG